MSGIVPRDDFIFKMVHGIVLLINRINIFAMALDIFCVLRSGHFGAVVIYPLDRSLWKTILSCVKSGKVQDEKITSGFPATADIARTSWNVRVVP